MNDAAIKKAEDVYYKRFPFARVFEGELWSIELTEIKMTDITLGFRKKIAWCKNNDLALEMLSA